MDTKPLAMTTLVLTRAGAPETGTAGGPSHPGSQGPLADPASMSRGWQGPQSAPATVPGTVPFEGMSPVGSLTALGTAFPAGRSYREKVTRCRERPWCVELSHPPRYPRCFGTVSAHGDWARCAQATAGWRGGGGDKWGGGNKRNKTFSPLVNRMFFSRFSW